MSALVRYRDLPGGPTELKFSDELSRFCLCTNCGMLSMSMLKDENEHMFCETCLIEASDKHHREHIYCSFEKKEISIFEMFEANELVTMIRDQYVNCPNTKCKALVTLDELKIHYEQCQPTVTCPTCDQQIQTAEWSKHNEGCNKREGAVPELRPTCVSSSPRAPPVTMESIWNTKDTCNSLPSSKQLQQTQQPTNNGADKIVLCEHCAKKVKERNMTLHLKACPRVPQLCVYCEKNFSKEDFKSHLTKCNKNPDNVKKEMPKNDKEARKTKPANPPHAPAVNKASKPPASGNTKNDARPRPEVPEATVTTQRPGYGGKKAGGNTANKSTSNGARQNSNGTGPNPATKSSIPRPKGASNSRPGAEQGAVPADTPSKRTSYPTTTNLHKPEWTYFPTMALDEGKTAKTQAEPRKPAHSPRKRSYSPIKTTLLKNECTHSPTRHERETANYQGVKRTHSHNQRSNSPTRTTRPRNRCTCIFTRKSNEVETADSYGAKVEALTCSAQSKDNWSYSTTRTTHFQNTWNCSSAKSLDETLKSQEDKVPSPRGSPYDSGIPVLPALSVPHKDIVAWFREVESYFYTSGVCENRQKYLTMARSLTPQVQEVVEDILNCPPRVHAYECLLISLFRRNMPAVEQCQSEPLRFHEFVQQLPFELRVKFKSRCAETIAISACLHR